ncbi:divalent cation tolerance protein [Streptomyces inusitatus]|uniref:Divalent cation tolerance protein n=1 Tax=Streptomyces inusitatus TaxID=68221 RepID=A0A918QCU1_9ACTN|nr:divalent-cation tolerance protein CutA [Streptomyces inusitatus]GGZ41919.1 divalent cation tolerance protein [Streptomyces inusitatus]
MTPADLALVTTTTATEPQARALADAAITERLAACAQIHPISSVYRWEGKIQHDQEWRIDFKTRGSLVRSLTDFILDHHDYDTPEVIAVPVTGGSAAYLEWVAAETRVM